MWKIFRLFLNIIWLCDVLDLSGFEFLDTTYPINTLWWIIIWILVGSINND